MDASEGDFGKYIDRADSECRFHDNDNDSLNLCSLLFGVVSVEMIYRWISMAIHLK